MLQNYELVQKGFRILVGVMSGYICRELKRQNRDGWWNDVLSALYDQHDLPEYGDDQQLMDSLDVANCIRLLDRKWNDVFRTKLKLQCRNWSRELMGVRNQVAHQGQQDLEQADAERALNTMVLLCAELDAESADELRDLYLEIRARANDLAGYGEMPEYTGVAQPETESRRGELLEGSLLQMVGTEYVEKTALTHKVTFGGKTVLYPVYRVRLDALYYNNQNDRIATWISRYESEHGKDSLYSLHVEEYNQIIEDFIYQSNPDAIRKTQMNIKLSTQREPGVTLADGRVVDGNRRFTCLRRLQREEQEPRYFETVIMDMDIEADKKQIKLLELAIQHGEEKKVDYDLIDFAVGTYRDVVQTKLLTIEEYAASTNESIADVKKRIEIAGIIDEFLNYICMPEQYHVAREYQVYSVFQEMLTPLKQLNEADKQRLKTVAFNNAIMEAIPDQRKFIRDIKQLVKSGTYADYFDEQERIGKAVMEKYQAVDIHGKEDIAAFAQANPRIMEDMQNSMERAMLRSRNQHLKALPADTVSKSTSMLMDIDPRLFARMDPDEKENLKAALNELIRTANGFIKLL